MKINFTVFILFFSVSFLFNLMSARAETVGMFVNDFRHILGNEQQEEKLLDYALTHGFNYLLLYNLTYSGRNQIDLNDEKNRRALATFIRKAKTQYGILEVGAVGERFSFFEQLQQHNYLSWEERIDVFHLEFEFWNQHAIDRHYCSDYLSEKNYSCDTDGAFSYYLKELKALRQLSAKNNIKCETYIGTPSAKQSRLTANHCDRILVHFYRSTDTYKDGRSIYNFKNYRLRDLAPAHGKITVLPIFASTDQFMGDWLKDHSPEEAYETFLYGKDGYLQDTGAWKAHIDLAGYQWYRYTDMQKTEPNPETKRANNHLAEQAETDRGGVSDSAPITGSVSYPSLVPANHSNITVPEIQLYPNPTTDAIHIRTGAMENEEVVITDQNGRMVKSAKTRESVATQKIDVSDLKEGIYTVRVAWSGGWESRSFVIASID